MRRTTVADPRGDAVAPSRHEDDRLRLTRPGQWMRPLPENNGWGAMNTLISGIALFTLLGWLAGRWLGAPWLAAVGILLGMASAMIVIWFRYGNGRVDQQKSDEAASGAPRIRTDNMKENR